MFVTIMAAFVALEHVGFALLEMVFWKRPAGLRIFGQTPEQAEQTAVLALNQGLYNLFLAAGLVVSFFLPAATAHSFRLFFLCCVLVAGIVGGLTAKRTILFVQGGPALLGLIAICL